LALLLLAHALIVVVYDINMLYLRIASVALPLPFAFYLFKTQKRSLLGWFIATAFLAASSVIGMSAITALLDHTPILPQSMIEWREFLEYAASITLSFLTGMLLGGVAYHRAHRVVKKKDGLFLSALVSKFSNSSTAPMDMHEKIQKIEEIGGGLIAAGTTAMSIYTGLKDYL
jgi:archaellum biogenesis protein FlaJ (TadC family)